MSRNDSIPSDQEFAAIKPAPSRQDNITRSRSRSSVRSTNSRDIDRELRLRDHERSPSLHPVKSAASSGNWRRTISFEPNDPGNPYNWSRWRKVWIVVVGILTVINSTFSSSLPSFDSEALAQHFGVTNQLQLVLPTSIYITGYVIGPLLFAPLSESYGRQAIMIGTFAGFTIFTLATCFAPNWAAFNIFRLLVGTFASSPISVTGGMYADLYSSPVLRGRAMASFMTATVWGPFVGPVASGYLSEYSWRWPFWLVLIMAGVTMIPVVFLPETYGPVILQRRARKMRKEDPDCDMWAPLDFETTTARDIVTVFLGRPFRMLFFEMLVGASCIYLSFLYGVVYLFFEAYAVIYPPVYGFNLGETGLAFFGIGVGGILACGIYLWWDWQLQRARDTGAKWSQKEEYRRLPLACIGGPCFAIGILWIAWTSRPSVHWIVSIIGGIPLGIGYLLVFMSLINYMVDAYEIFAASALAAASCSRSVFGTVLPFASGPMYDTLGIAWATSLLGFVALALCIIPFMFIVFGNRIRARSSFCQELAEKKAAREAKEEKIKKRLAEEERFRGRRGSRDDAASGRESFEEKGAEATEIGERGSRSGSGSDEMV